VSVLVSVCGRSGFVQHRCRVTGRGAGRLGGVGVERGRWAYTLTLLMMLVTVDVRQHPVRVVPLMPQPLQPRTHDTPIKAQM